MKILLIYCWGLNYLPLRRKQAPGSNRYIVAVTFDDPLSILEITNQFHNCAVCLHAAQ
jgi:hypothetical protein